MAINAVLKLPIAIIADGFGNLFIDDLFNDRIRKINTNGIITTFAGGSLSGFKDGVEATNTVLGATDLAFDSAGDMFLSCGFTVRKIDTSGIITTVVGNSTNYFPGYSGDGGPATNASLNNPDGLTFDAAGNLFIADTYNHVIRKVDCAGMITTIAGNSTNGYSGDGSAATNASLSYPEGLLVDAAGNLLIADSGNGLIRQVNASGIISTIVGGYTNTNLNDGGPATNASLWGPQALARDTLGNLFIADSGDCLIRRVSPEGIITTVAGNGTNDFSGDGGRATDASLNYPSGIMVDASGNLFISDIENNRIRKVTNTQGPRLTLNNVTAANAGHYQVVVTDRGGSVTSSVVNLIVASAPLVYQTAHRLDGTVALNFLSQPNSTNEVQCATNLAPPITWQTLSTNLAGPDGNWQFTDTNAPGGQMRFYRSHKR